jgi:ABC-2 type transport system permease protein
MELLKTSPITDLQIVLAKYLGALTMLVLLLVLTLEYPLFIILCGHPDKGPMLLSYLGLFLLGASYLAIGIFTSAITNSQMIAAIVAFVISIMLWFVGDSAGPIGEKISIIQHIQSFSIGVLDTADLGYYLLMIFIFIFLTWRVLEAERWR